MDISNLPITRFLLRTPSTIRWILLAIIGFGIFYIHKYYFIGVLLYFLIIFLLFVISEYSIILYHELEPDIMKKQYFVFIIATFFIGNMVFYVYQLESKKAIQWKPLYFEYGQYNSKKYPSDGWFSAKRKDNLILESLTDCIGFGFPISEASDPVYFKPDFNIPFKISYLLEKEILVGAIFEGKQDVKLSETKVFFLPASSGEKICILSLKEFKWKRPDNIKHLKFICKQLPLCDELFIRMLLIFGLDNIVNNFYLKAY